MSLHLLNVMITSECMWWAGDGGGPLHNYSLISLRLGFWHVAALLSSGRFNDFTFVAPKHRSEERASVQKPEKSSAANRFRSLLLYLDQMGHNVQNFTCRNIRPLWNFNAPGNCVIKVKGRFIAVHSVHLRAQSIFILLKCVLRGFYRQVCTHNMTQTFLW